MFLMFLINRDEKKIVEGCEWFNDYLYLIQLILYFYIKLVYQKQKSKLYCKCKIEF